MGTFVFGNDDDRAERARTLAHKTAKRHRLWPVTDEFVEKFAHLATFNISVDDEADGES